MTKYTMHTDPGHGWVEVAVSEIQRLGIAGQISAYSYRDGKTAYLEEDCDMGAFMRAKNDRGELFTLAETHSNRDSFIRKLPRFN